MANSPFGTDSINSLIQTSLTGLNSLKGLTPYEQVQLNMQKANFGLNLGANQSNNYYAGLNTALAQDYADQQMYNQQQNRQLAGIDSIGKMGLGLVNLWEQHKNNSKSLELQKQNTLVKLAEQNMRWKATVNQANAKYAAMLGARAGSGRNRSAVNRAIETYDANKMDMSELTNAINSAKSKVNNISIGDHSFEKWGYNTLGFLGGLGVLTGLSGQGILAAKNIFGSQPLFNNNFNKYIKDNGNAPKLDVTKILNGGK